MANDENEIQLTDDEPVTDFQAEEAEAREVDLDEDEAKDQSLSKFDPDSPNLVPFYEGSEKGRQFLEELARTVVDDFDRAWESSEEYREKREEHYRIMTGFLKTKSFPFEGCANAHAPLMLERLLRLSSNLFAEIFTDHDTVFAVSPTGPDDTFTADILSRHGNWQIKNILTDFLRQHHRGLQEFVAIGSVFCHSYYDDVAQRNRHDILTCDEFAIPYVWVTTEPDMSDVPYKVKIIRKYRHELQRLKKVWSGIEKVLDGEPPEPHEDPDVSARETVAQSEGFKPTDGDPNAPYKFLQYDGWATLPGEEDLRPVTVIVDYRTHAVCRLLIREEEDWRDRARFDRQTAEFQQWQQDMEMFNGKSMQEQQLRQRLMMPDVPPDESELLLSQLDAFMHQPPQKPTWMKTQEHMTRGPDPVRRVPMEMFSHGVCIENPMGALGISYGSILADENKMADEALNRFYDAATLANAWGLVIPEGLNIDSGSIPFGPGKVTRVRNVSGADLRQSLVELKPASANPQLVDMARMAAEWGDGVTVSGIVSGEPGKSGETYRGVATRLERAVKQLSVAGVKYLDFLSQILRNNAKLNAMFLPEGEVVEVVNDMGAMDLADVNRELYRRDYKVTFSADVRFASQAQRIAEADEIVQMIGTLPPLQQNPAFVYAAIKDSLMARGKRHLVPLLGPPPPAPEMPMGSQPPPPPPGAPGAPAGGGGAPAIPTGAGPEPGAVPGPQPGPEVQA
jgi:hypothetical protein